MHTLISYWLICQETRNEIEVNAQRLSVLGLFDFRQMTYTPRRREYIFTHTFFLRAETWHTLPRSFGVTRVVHAYILPDMGRPTTRFLGPPRA